MPKRWLLLTLGNYPLSVETTRGTLCAPFYVSGITYADTSAEKLANNAAVAFTGVGAALASANANSKSLQFANIGSDPVAIGATGITWAKRYIVLNEGDTRV